MPKSVQYTKTIINCMECPHCKHEGTPGAGLALDYWCYFNNAEPKLIKGYVEMRFEGPQDNQIPKWCNLPVNEE